MFVDEFGRRSKGCPQKQMTELSLCTDHAERYSTAPSTAPTAAPLIWPRFNPQGRSILCENRHEMCRKSAK